MKKEYSVKSKILRKIVIGIAVYGAAYLVSLIALSSLVSLFRYGKDSINMIATLVAGFAAFLTITADEKPLLLFDTSAVFSKKPYLIILFILFVILTSYSLTVSFNFLYSKIPWQVLGNKYVVQDNESLYAIPLLVRIIAYVIIGPFAEEVLFRGVVFFRFKRILPVWASVLAASIFFGLYHGNLMQGTYAFFMGSVMCLVMHYGGSFFYPLVFHIVANLISNLCFESSHINNVVYSTPSIIASIAYIVVAIIISYVFKGKLTKKDKKC